MLENGAKDHFKKHSRETLTLENDERSEESIEASVLKGELKAVIMRSIERLDKDQRYVFVETEIKGRSYDELVRETGEKLGTLLSRKSRAVKKLKEMIREYMDQEDI